MSESNRLSCLIVDDEPLARQLLEHYVLRHPRLDLTASCSTAAAAASMLHQNQVELLLLDIRMPRMSGLDFLRSMAHPPAVIFTTAYSEHAAEAFDLMAVDYLVKPISYERFAQAVSRILGSVPTGSGPLPTDDCIFLRSEGRLERVAVSAIEIVEACENYVRFHTARKTYMTKRTMKEVESLLGANGFVRAHRRFLVNAQMIERVHQGIIRVGNHVLPVSRSGREAILRELPLL
jgi:two-component system LytT family response regulator